MPKYNVLCHNGNLCFQPWNETGAGADEGARRVHAPSFMGRLRVSLRRRYQRRGFATTGTRAGSSRTTRARVPPVGPSTGSAIRITAMPN